ncbi:MAG TPA: toll/interleukin-1 receptor domain-containing protein [Candidatus Acidoferrum sp.]|nr:toll/interleukin-1 receptor domain-containing protein [Candidatus Acidoferrum sp.]
MQIFFSYDASDKEFAKILGDQLSKRGLSPWIVDAELMPGDNWAIAIGEALKRSRAMVVLLSPDSVKSEYLKREVEFALGDSKFEGRIFPVVVRPTKDVPWILRTLRVLDAKQGPNRVAASIADALKMVASPN